MEQKLGLTWYKCLESARPALPYLFSTRARCTVLNHEYQAASEDLHNAVFIDQEERLHSIVM